jgi:hypothetical protein
VADGLKWRVNNAVTRSTLPPHARLLMFVLANRADTRTAVIPDEHTPSLADLADESGLGLATVKRYLNLLETNGWVQRERPTDEERVRGVRTRYRLAIGKSQNTAQAEPREDRDTAQCGPSEHGSERAVPGLTVSLGTAQAEPRHGSERAQGTAQAEPSTYIPIASDLSDQLHGADAPRAAEPEGLFEAPPQAPVAPAEDNTQTLLGEWLKFRAEDRPPERIISRVGKELKALLAEGIRYDDVRQGLADWARKDAGPSALPGFVNGATARRRATESTALAVPAQYGGNVVPIRPSTADQRVAQARAVGAQLQAQLESGALQL